MDSLDFEHIGTLPVKVHEGVLYKELVSKAGAINPLTKELVKEKKPIYIVEHIVDPNGFDMAVVYRPKAGAHPPIKDFDTTRVETKYANTTVLGVLASKVGRKSSRSRTTEKPPLFVAPVIEGTDTFTGAYGLGFLEREPDKFTADGSLKEGRNTGVFITLDSIMWGRTYVPTSHVLDEHLAIKKVWFDMQ